MVKKRPDTIIISDIMDSLSPIIRLLTPEQIEELKEHLSIRHFKKNQIMYKEGDVPQYFHCLISGKVKIYKDGVGGRTQIIRVIKPVEFFGYRAYFANQNYVTAAAAFEATTLCLIPMELVNKWTRTNLPLALYFVKHLSIELGSSDQRTVNLTQKHIRGRLAEALLFLKDSYGLEEDGATLSIYLSREDLASLSNMTTSNAIRTLSAFANEHIVAIDGRKIKLIDEEQIKKISKIG
ncbi:MAG: Crp/Fnr family transcriptional regulator [Bacteroidaceae bacterium]|nr:Crp/Fnr family transcriptional regulator [Bacteroidaceae bacterium]